jgi:hypothetical protein
MSDTVLYKYFKLVSGEGIICKTEDDCKNIYKQKTVSVTDPVILNPVRIPRGEILIESYIMYPWFSFSPDNVYEIPTQQIVLASNIKESLKKNYVEYLTQQAKRDREEMSEEESFEMDDDDEDLIDDELEDEMIQQILEGDDYEENGRIATGSSKRTLH